MSSSLTNVLSDVFHSIGYINQFFGTQFYEWDSNILLILLMMLKNHGAPAVFLLLNITLNAVVC